MKYSRVNRCYGQLPKRLLLAAGIAVGMNASVALAQDKSMSSHENMASGEHAKHHAQEDTDKTPPPESGNRTEQDKPDPKKPKPDGHQHQKP